MADNIKETDAGGRYAQAVFDLAVENTRLNVVEADLKALQRAYVDSADLRRLLTSPTFSNEDKAAGLAGVAAKAKFDPITAKFLGLVAQNGRAGDLMAAIVSFERLSAEHRGVVTADVTSAAPMTAAQSSAVAQALRAALGKEPEITTRVDPSLLGGVKVRVGSRLFDASLKSKLDSLKFALKRA